LLGSFFPDRRTTALTAAMTVLLVVALLPSVSGRTLARFTAASAPDWQLAADTLNPPTGLTATGGTSVTLSWTPTVDAYASGYLILRSASTGGPYSQIATVTPHTATATADSPGAGTWYYVLRSSFQNWTSANSNQASAVVSFATSTGFHGCTGTSNAADTGGDGNGYETTPANACADGGGISTDAASGTNNVVSCSNAGKDRHRWWDFSLGVPAGASAINGITVRADIGLNNNGGTSLVCAQLSWDGGTSWTALQSITPSGAAETTYLFGGPTDAWGRTWTSGELSNANFCVRIVDASSQTTKDFRLDYLAVEVHYTP
jgi:hypothetical protein